jgi:O-antigen/teichoic acid export membrane protein
MVKTIFKSAFARNTGWMIAGQGVRLAIQALYFIEIARSLGVRNYGAFVGVVALVGTIYPFGSLGGGNLLVKNVARDKQLFAPYWGRALAHTIGFGTVLIIGVSSIARWVLPPEIPLRLVVLVGAADIVGLNIATISAQAFQAFERLNWTASVYVMLSSGRLVGALLLIAFHRHPSPLQWGVLYFGSTATVALMATFLVCANLGPPMFKWPHSFAEMREGFYFAASLTAQTVYNDIDKTMLARLSTLEATGIYSAAYRIIDVSFVPVSALLWSSYAGMFRTGAQGISATLAYAAPLLRRALLYAAFVSVALFLSAGAVPFFLGHDFDLTAEALRWLAVLPILKAVHYFLSDTLSGTGHQLTRTCMQAGVAIFNVLVNLWIIPAYSWRGAAVSSIMSDGALAVGIGAAVFFYARRSLPTVGSAIPATVSG